MTTPIKIGPVSPGHSIRVATRTPGSGLTVTHLKEGEVWSSHVYPGLDLRISEVDPNEPVIGRTHIGRMASSP